MKMAGVSGGLHKWRSFPAGTERRAEVGAESPAPGLGSGSTGKATRTHFATQVSATHRILTRCGSFVEEGVLSKTFAGARSDFGVGQPGIRSLDSLEGVQFRPGALFSAP